MYKYAALLAVLLVAGCASTAIPANVNTAGAVVKAGDKIDVEYTGSFVNGTVFDSSVGRSPFQFTAGSSQVIKGFDKIGALLRY